METEHATTGSFDMDAVTSRVLAIDGVTDVYPPAGALTELPHIVAGLITAAPHQIGHVRIATDDTATAYTARIATSQHTDAPTVGKHVADTLLETVADNQNATITIQIARIS